MKIKGKNKNKKSGISKPSMLDWSLTFEIKAITSNIIRMQRKVFWDFWMSLYVVLLFKVFKKTL